MVGCWMGGVSPKAIQTLMRHSKIDMTLGQYGHLLPDEVVETVARMPTTDPSTLRLTGTAESMSPAAAPYGAQTAASTCNQKRNAKRPQRIAKGV